MPLDEDLRKFLSRWTPALWHCCSLKLNPHRKCATVEAFQGRSYQVRQQRGGGPYFQWVTLLPFEFCILNSMILYMWNKSAEISRIIKEKSPSQRQEDGG